MPPDSTRHLWSEHVPYVDLRQPRLLSTLAERGIELDFAVGPTAVPDVASVVRACREHGTRVAVWPLVGDGEGRWANAENANAYIAHVRALLAALEHEGVMPDGVALDLEPPIGMVRALLRGRFSPAWLVWRSFERYVASLSALVTELRARALRVTAAVPPFVLFDAPGALGPWQRMMAAPIEMLACDRINVMAYTSLFEGYSRGIVRRAVARRALRWFCMRAAQRYGSRAAVSLGVVGGGALGDERPYRSVRELQEDIAIAHAAGIRDIAVYSLDGILGRPPEARWLDAMAVGHARAGSTAAVSDDLVETVRSDQATHDRECDRAVGAEEREPSRQAADDPDQTKHQVEDTRAHRMSE